MTQTIAHSAHTLAHSCVNLENNSQEYKTALRLLDNGSVTDSTTFADLEHILQQDALEQSTVSTIKNWFSTFDVDNYSAADGNLAADLLVCWFNLDQRDFLDTFGA